MQFPHIIIHISSKVTIFVVEHRRQIKRWKQKNGL